MKRLLLLLALLLLLPALAVAQEEPPVLCVAVYYRAGVLELVVIPCPGAEATPTPTSTPTATPTVTPTATATWTPFPTPTLTPTPTPESDVLFFSQPCTVQPGGAYRVNVRSLPDIGGAFTGQQVQIGQVVAVSEGHRDATGSMWLRVLDGRGFAVGYIAGWVMAAVDTTGCPFIDFGP